MLSNQRDLILIRLSDTVIRIFSDFPHLVFSEEGQIAIQVSKEGAELMRNGQMNDDFVESYHLTVIYLCEALARYIKMN